MEQLKSGRIMSLEGTPRKLPPPLPSKLRRQNGAALRWLGWSAMVMVLCASGFGVAVLALSEFGFGVTFMAFFLATLPVPIYAGLILWLDRIEGEPPLMILVAFLWGATASVFFGYMANTFFGAVLEIGTGSAEVAAIGSAVLSAPVTEECAKAGILLLFFLFYRGFDGPLDGLVYGGIAGLGFAMSENVFYYGRALAEGEVLDAGVLFVLRGLFFALSHPVFTTFTGIGVAMAVKARSGIVKAIWIFGGLGCAITAHFAWNMGATFGAEGALGILLVMTLLGVLFILGLAVVTLCLERSVLRKHLAREQAEGLFRGDLYRWAVSLRRRLLPLPWLLPTGVSAKLMREFTRVATELAFSRERSLHLSGWRYEEESTYQETLEARLRVLVQRLPPVL